LLLPAIHRDHPLNGPDPNQSVFDDEGPDWLSWDNIGKSGIKVYQTLIFYVLGPDPSVGYWGFASEVSENTLIDPSCLE
jgi:hypothetical protein